MEKIWEEDYLNTNAHRENELIQYWLYNLFLNYYTDVRKTPGLQNETQKSTIGS